MLHLSIISIGVGLASIIAAIATAVGGVSASLINRKSQQKLIDSEQENLDATNSFNQAQYEDWKYYNSLDQRLQRAEKAGVSKWAALGINDTLPSAFQIGNSSVPNDNGLSSLAQLTNSIANSTSNAANSYVDREFQRQQKEVDAQIKREGIEVQKQQLEALKSYRKELMAQQKYMFDEKLGVSLADLSWKRTFYNSPEYLGYWQVKNAKQTHNYLAQTNPINIEILKNRKLITDAEARSIANYLDARNTLLASNARLALNRADISDSLFELEKQIAANRLNNPNNTKAGQWINFGLNKANQLLDMILSTRSKIFGVSHNSQGSYGVNPSYYQSYGDDYSMYGF